MNTTMTHPSAAHGAQSFAHTGSGRPSAAAGISLILRRELASYLKSIGGYVIATLILLLNGLFFNVYAIGSSARYSTDVLSDFFFYSSGFVMISAVLISMRLIAEERQAGSLPLLTTSSLTDGEIIIAKFLSGFAFLAFLTAVTVYMPLLIFWNGKVSLGHIFSGYLGLFCLGAAATAIGTFGSAVAKSQVVAAVTSSALIVFFLLQWKLANVVEGPLSDVIGYLALHDKHFTPFKNGTISLKDIVFYFSITAFFLVLARNALEGRRWKP